MRESAVLEFKERISDSFLKTVSAFANYGDGLILFGISDEGEEIGLPNPEKDALSIENKINDAIKPHPNYSLKLDASKKVLYLRVKEGPYKPYLYRGKAYKRHDTSTVEVDYPELKRLVLLGSQLYFEDLPYEGELSFHYLGKKFSEILDVNKMDKNVLKTLGLYQAEGKFNNAALLFSDQNSFPGIDMVRFGEDMNEFRERQKLEKMSVLEAFDRAVDSYRSNYQREEIWGVERRRVDMVPEEAFREALANALVHREWDLQEPVRLAFKEEAIEIFSPGGLPFGVSPEEYLAGFVSVMRNPKVGNIFFRLRYIEAFGTGIRRIKTAYQGYARQPDFKIQENSIHVTLPILSTSPDLSVDEEAVFRILSRNRAMASSEIVEKTGFGKNKVLGLLKSLMQENYVIKIGNGRGTRYKKA